MIDLSYQVNNPLIKVTQAMMAAPLNHSLPEHEGIHVAFLIDGVRFKPI